MASDGDGAASNLKAAASNQVKILPQDERAVTHGDKQYTTVKEGLAYILVPKGSEAASPKPGKEAEPPAQTVFYNPIQQFNRDLTVLAIKAYGGEAIAERRRRWEQRLRQGPKKKKGKALKRKREDIEDAEPRAEESSPSNGADASVAKIPAAPANSPPASEEAPQVVPSGTESTKSFKSSFRILDALSATGLRAIRYAHELPFATSITANDLLPAATKQIKLNVEHNRVEGKVRVTTGNALSHMYGVLGDSGRHGPDEPGGKYDVVDLDPYGTAAPFFDAAVQALSDGGMLCATCTDSGVFASAGYPEKTFALYGGAPLRGPHSHEGGLRLILHAIAMSAARYGLAIEPLLTLSIDYYARTFVRIRRSPAEVKFLAGKTMLVYSCDQGCGAWTTQPLARNKEAQDKKGDKFYKHGLAQGPSAGQHCPHCGFKTHLAGPMYGGPLHSSAFVQRILDDLPAADNATYPTKPRIEGMLLTALEEDLSPPSPSPTLPSPNPPARLLSAVDSHPFFFIPHALSKVLHCPTPPENAVRGGLRSLGYRVARSHCKPGSIKTDAPWAVVWDVMRSWVRQRAGPLKEGAIKEGTAGWGIMHGPSPLSQTAAAPPAASTDDDQNAPQSVGKVEEEPAGPTQPIVFDEDLGRASKASKRVVRYQLNPTANWGPMSRAKG
ncbi:MAG: RNA methyltransferase tRNA(m5U54)methyltransferase [Thelocarpon impressellum]|nr:MAG: RNA methyltransferase tRNA(m5U54)methyltransferase [Thelocarpon impressellum]